MISELLVTSAPRGLQAGRSGFTTVYRTKGIHPDLASRLEAASGYRHVFPQGDPRNPIIFSYTNRSSTIGEVWVMSRIGDAGTDYSGRSNKIAHHIALQQDDTQLLVESNPAEVMRALAANQTLMSRWEGEPRESPVPPRLPVPPKSSGVCQSWAVTGGDAGWAGFLVEKAINKESTWIIVPPDVDLLALFSEALALVSPDQRWRIPFTTYSLRGDEGRWLGVVAGSPEAAAALAQSRISVIDLTLRAAVPGGGAYVAAARGQGTVPWHRLPQLGQAASVTSTGSAQRSSHSVTTSAALGGTRQTPVSPPALTRAPALGASQPPEMTEWEEVLIPKKRFSRIALMVAAGCLLLCFSLPVLIFATGTGVFEKLWPRETASHEEPKASQVEKPENPPPKTDRSQEDQRSLSSDKLANGKTQEKKKENTPSQSMALAKGAPKNGREDQPEPKKPVDTLLFAALKQSGNLPQQGINTELPTNAKISLIEWSEEADPESLKQISLSLPPIKWPQNQTLDLRISNETSNARKWDCIQNDEQEPFGSLILGVKGLSFEPAQDAPRDAGQNKLAFVPLRISRKDDQDSCYLQLVKPENRKVLQFESSSPSQMQNNPSNEGQVTFLEAAVREGAARLVWSDCKIRPQSPVSTLQISWDEDKTVSFKDSLAGDLPLKSDSPVQLWWRPSAFAEKQGGTPSLFRERLKVSVDPKFDNTGPSLNGRSDFALNRTLGQAASDKNRRIKNLLINQRGKKTQFSYTTFIDNFKNAADQLLPENENWKKLSPKDKLEKFQNLLASDEEQDESVEKWLERVKPHLASKGPVKDAIDEEVKNFFAENPYQPKQQSLANENTDDKKKREQKEKEDYEQTHRAKISKDCSQSDDFLLKVIERLDPAADDTIEWAGLFFWHALWKYNEALKYGFVCSPSLRNGGGEQPLVLEEIAGKAYLTVSGELHLHWEPDSNKIPPVRLVRFVEPEKAQAGEEQAAAEVQSTSENQARDTSRRGGGD